MENDDDEGSNSLTDSSLESVDRCISLKKVFSARKWRSKNSIEVICVCSVLIFMASTVPNIQWPFIIPFLQSQGASTLACSAYAACMSVFLLLTSLFSPKIKRLLNLKAMLILCTITLCGSTCLHGLVIKFDNITVIVILSIAVRALQGISATMIQVLSVSILISRFPQKCGRVSAVNETALGLGFTLAPLLGGVCFDKVGFLLTFVIIGGCGSVMVGPLSAISYRKFKHGADDPYSSFQWRDFLFLSPLLPCFLSTICETCVDFAMALYVKDVFNEDATFAGMLLSGLSMSSLLFAFLMGYICDQTNPFILGICGSLMSCVGLVVMVPPPWLPFLPTTKTLLSIGAITVGFGQAMTWLHVMPAMIFVKTKCRDKVVDGCLSNVVSLLYVVATSSGEVAGSYIAGALITWCEYWQYFGCLSALMFTTTVICICLYLKSTFSISKQFDSIGDSDDTIVRADSGSDKGDTTKPINV